MASNVRVSRETIIAGGFLSGGQLLLAVNNKIVEKTNAFTQARLTFIARLPFRSSDVPANGCVMLSELERGIEAYKQLVSQSWRITQWLSTSNTDRAYKWMLTTGQEQSQANLELLDYLDSARKALLIPVELSSVVKDFDTTYTRTKEDLTHELAALKEKIPTASLYDDKTHPRYFRYTIEDRNNIGIKNIIEAFNAILQKTIELNKAKFSAVPAAASPKTAPNTNQPHLFDINDLSAVVELQKTIAVKEQLFAFLVQIGERIKAKERLEQANKQFQEAQAIGRMMQEAGFKPT